MDGRERVHFSYMGTYWSCTYDVWEYIGDAVYHDKPFDLNALGCRELRFKPYGRIWNIRKFEDSRHRVDNILA